MSKEKEKSIDNILINKICTKLIRNNLSISVVESCTGGMICEQLISFSGISGVFLEGAVTYSNESKVRRVGVKKETLYNYGAVSKETAEEMVVGIVKESGSNIAISTTGLAGPGGGTVEKPVGLVYIGIYIYGDVIVYKNNFEGSRNEIRVKTTNAALELLSLELTKRGY